MAAALRWTVRWCSSDDSSLRVLYRLVCSMYQTEGPFQRLSLVLGSFRLRADTTNSAIEADEIQDRDHISMRPARPPHSAWVPIRLALRYGRVVYPPTVVTTDLWSRSGRVKTCVTFPSVRVLPSVRALQSRVNTHT